MPEKQPHICLVNCLHPPDDVRVVHKLGRAMREAGFRVVWVGPQAPRKGEDFGIEMHYYPPGRGRPGRVLHHHRRAFRLAMSLDPADVYVGVEPDSAATAVKLARRRGGRAIFDVHEAYDDEMLSRWASGLTRRFLSHCVRRRLRQICSQCDLVMGVNEAVLAPYAEVGTPRLIVRNCAPVSFAAGAPADVCAPGRKHFVLVQGMSTLTHGTRAVLQAAGLAAERVAGLKVVFFNAFFGHGDGFGPEQFQQLAHDAGAEDLVDLRDRIPISQMPEVLRTCDVGLITYNRTWGVKSLPNKLFEYMAAGLAIIGPSYGMEIAPIIRQENCGLLVDCEDPAALADAIVHLREHPRETAEMGRRAREAFLQRHNFQVEVKPLLEQIRAWASETPPPRR
jgi:glycosyltransferase involved in cell wall biosynthesis